MKLIILLFILITSTQVFSESKIEVINPVIRIPLPEMMVTAMFVTLKNNTDNDFKIVKATGDVAGVFELHAMEMSGGKMKMRPVSEIVLKKRAITELKPGGLHVMLFNLKKPLLENDVYNINFILNDKSIISVKAVAKVYPGIN